MPQFQGGQFLPMFQRKWDIERQQKEPVGNAFAQGVGAGVNQSFAEQSQKKTSQYNLALSLIKRQFSNSKPFYKSSGKDLTFEEEMQLANKIAGGNFKMKESDIAFKPREVTKSKYRTTKIIPTNENMADLKRYLKGYDFQVGQPIEVATSTYDRFLTNIGKEPSYKLQEKKLQFQRSKSSGKLTDSQILNYWKYLNKSYTDPFTDDGAKEEIFDEMEELRNLYENVIAKAKTNRGVKTDEDPAGLGF